MNHGEDLDPYRPTPSVDGTTIARRVARTLGALAGLAVSLSGVALYALRCFDTCPSDPAEDKVGQLLTGSLILFGLVVVVAAASAGTRWSRTGWSIIAVLGLAIGVCGIASVALVPAIDTPGANSSYTTYGIVGIVVGAGGAGAALVLRRRGT